MENENRVHGEWLYEPEGIFKPAFKCSVCGTREAVLLRWNFCPMCGADMRETKTEEI